jgi:preprotein translocase subunit SecG
MYVDFLTLIVPLMLIVTVALQVLATRRVRGNISFEPDQRRAQLWLIWLVPVLGAALVLAVLLQEPEDTVSNQQGESNNRVSPDDNSPPRG